MRIELAVAAAHPEFNLVTLRDGTVRPIREYYDEDGRITLGPVNAVMCSVDLDDAAYALVNLEDFVVGLLC
ncbi:hypothetical protein [Pelagibacterium montanilacus]|uniref:hypothetical protein n=1 Tax=Pelagibacterium montanilacus TaxID=2185280 RepID=UPI000F8DC7EC|nr:hypothetical protein [Pelagibacterium montanilacus]